ncbi:MAG: transposase [Planctomycetaceae bacterium]
MSADTVSSHYRHRPRRSYPSDLADPLWRQIEPLLPAPPPRGRRRSTSLRDVVDGIVYRWDSGCTWRMLPHDFPPWPTIYTYYRRWQQDGTLARLREVLRHGQRA